VLWIQAEVGMLPRHVTGVDVVVLVPGDGVSADGEGKLKKKDSEKKGDAQGDPYAAGAAVQLRGLGQFPSDWVAREAEIRASFPAYQRRAARSRPVDGQGAYRFTV
jgi:hypothetical protein